MNLSKLFRLAFDVIFGVIVPIVCFIYDPFLLKKTVHFDPFLLKKTVYFDFIGFLEFFCGLPLLGPKTAFFVYPLAGIVMLALLGWLAFGRRLAKWGGVFFGVLSAGSISAGILTLPIFWFGIPGWIATYVYARNASQVRKAFPESAQKRTWLLQAIAGAVLLGGLAWLLSLLIQAVSPTPELPGCTQPSG